MLITAQIMVLKKKKVIMRFIQTACVHVLQMIAP